MKILGIDLAGKAENPSGICILDDEKLVTYTLFTDEEILSMVNETKPSVILIDAPLSLPQGRCCLEKNCECSVGGHFRQAERDIRKYGFVLPLTFRGMKMLTFRGIELGNSLKESYDVFETHPRTDQKVLGFKDIKTDLGKYFALPDNVSEHELDACMAAFTGALYKKNCYRKLGNPDEGIIIIPKGVKCSELMNRI